MAPWPLALESAPAMFTMKPAGLETEGLGGKDFQGNVILVVDRRTASARDNDRRVRLREQVR